MLTRHYVFEIVTKIYISDLQVQRIKIKVTLPFVNTSCLKESISMTLAGEKVYLQSFIQMYFSAYWYNR